jgi:integrase/recombinase XerD
VVRFCRYLAETQKIICDPCSRIKLPRRPRRIPRNVLTVRQANRLIGAADPLTHLGLRNRAMVEVLYASGIRNSELRNLKVEDINFADGWLSVRSGKGSKDRTVPLGKAALHYTGLYLEKARPDLAALHPIHDGYLFLSHAGGRLHAATLNDILEELSAKAGLKKRVTAHALRHTCATALLRGHADIRYICEMLGHSSLASTQIYTKVEITDLKKVHHRCHPREHQPIDKK